MVRVSLHRQFGQDILARHDQAELLARFAQRGIEHGVVFRIMLAAWKGDLPAMHAAGLAQNHNDMQFANLRAIDRNEHGGVDHRD